MAVAAIGAISSERAEYARDARLARALALVLDAFALGLLTFVVNSVYGVEKITSGSPVPDGAGFARFSTSTVVDWPWLLLMGLVYFSVTEATFGASPGKSLAMLRVIRVDGKPLDIRAVVIRNVLKPIDWLPILYLLGGVSVLITANSQRLGDLAAGTTVVYRHRALEPGATRSASPRARRIGTILLAAAVLFTITFNYFGRPPLVVEGSFNTRRDFPWAVTAYTLGTPEWGLGTVTYPITASTRFSACNGTITLRWSVLGWTEGGSSFSCVP
jgi:uncharacterized RDD family membrane protein YckC